MSSTKGFLWSFVFLLTAAIYGSIPTHLIFNYWAWLNTLRFDGEPIYTLLLLVLFLWIVALIITASGIPKGVYRFGSVSTIIIIGYMVVWFLLFQKIAFFSMFPP